MCYPLMLKGGQGSTGAKYRTIVEESLEDLLEKGGYQEVWPAISSRNFKFENDGKYEIIAELINIKNRPVLGDPYFEREMQGFYEKDYAPVDIRELLSVLDQHNIIQAYPPIFALASIIDAESSLLAACVEQSEFRPRRVFVEEV